MTDVGLTHIALQATDLTRTIDFYARYAAMEVVHERADAASGRRVVWLSDRTRPFVIVFIEARESGAVLTPFAHLGVGCRSRAEIDRLCEAARRDGVLLDGPTDSGPPIGYWAFLRDPDGNTLELAFGQEVGLAVESASAGR
jgi:catechol 2,3-dioxygenase-like lactoylglutathione lyase family enzyme